MLEIKGLGGERWDENQVTAKNAAAKKWVAAVNNHGGFGQWVFEICHAHAGDAQWSFGRKLRAALEKHAVPAPAVVLPFRRVEPRPDDRHVTCLPLVSLRAAAGAFGEEQIVGSWIDDAIEDWIAFGTSHRFSEGMFVTKVQGRSMEPKIPDGSYCLFRPAPHGSRNGRILLVWQKGLTDLEHGGQYTVKLYESEKVFAADGSFRHTRITLKPLNPDVAPIVLAPEDEGEVRVVGEFVEVLRA